MGLLPVMPANALADDPAESGGALASGNVSAIETTDEGAEKPKTHLRRPQTRRFKHLLKRTKPTEERKNPPSPLFWAAARISTPTGRCTAMAL